MKTVPGDSIRSLQLMLRTLAAADERLTPVVPDGIYGRDTENAVRTFQTLHSLPASGQTDLATWNAIVACYDEQSPAVLPPCPLQFCWQANTKLAPGCQNSHLFIMQSMLCAIARIYANVPAVSVTGILDDETEAAVKWLQKMGDLPVTGCICPVTWKYLAALYRLSCGDGTENGLVSCEDF